MKSQHVLAIIEPWYPGEEGGTAIPDVLFGSVNPSGHLRLTFYRSVDQLPDFHDCEMAHGRTYQYFRGDTLYTFGFGLSYTHFAYARFGIDKAKETFFMRVSTSPIEARLVESR